MTSSGNFPERELNAVQQQAIKSLFAGLPESFEERYAKMQSLRRAFYAELAKQLEPTINAYARSQPQGTLEERSALASWINRTCRQTGLALVSAHSNQPAILISDVSGRSKTKRFRFETTDPSGKRVRSGGSSEVPDLELMQAPLRVENFARDFQRDGKGEQSR
jgi:hypothetical protein